MKGELPPYLSTSPALSPSLGRIQDILRGDRGQMRMKIDWFLVSKYIFEGRLPEIRRALSSYLLPHDDYKR